MRLIDADAFKKVLSEHEMEHDKRRSFDDYDCGAANAYEHASDFLDDMPTITIPVAELDTTEDFGEWLDVNGDGSIMKCSKCGEEVCCKGNNFCPNCGADMRRKEGDGE